MRIASVPSYKVPSAAYWILFSLYAEEKRFSELTAGILPRATVTKLLPELEGLKYIERNVSKTRPVQVTYSITDKGKKFVDDGFPQALKDVLGYIQVMLQVKPAEVEKAIKQIQGMSASQAC